MIKLSYTDDLNILLPIGNNERLLEAYTGKKGCKWFPRAGAFYVIGAVDDQVIGMVEFYALSDVVIETHIFTLPQWWGSSITKEFGKQVIELVTKKTQYTKSITYVPGSAVQVQRYLETLGFKKSSVIPKGKTYNGEKVDLLIYILDTEE